MYVICCLMCCILYCIQLKVGLNMGTFYFSFTCGAECNAISAMVLGAQRLCLLWCLKLQYIKLRDIACWGI